MELLHEKTCLMDTHITKEQISLRVSGVVFVDDLPFSSLGFHPIDSKRINNLELLLYLNY